MVVPTDAELKGGAAFLVDRDLDTNHAAVPHPLHEARAGPEEYVGAAVIRGTRRGPPLCAAVVEPDPDGAVVVAGAEDLALADADDDVAPIAGVVPQREKRLRELYPKKGYSGMMRDAVAEHRRNLAVLRNTLTATSDECPPDALICGGGEPNQPTYSYDPDPSWDGQQEFPVDETIVPTVQEEIDSLQATPAEADGLRYYETLALTEGDYRLVSATGELTRDDLIRAAASGHSADGVSVQAVPLAVSVPLGIAAFFTPRIAFAWWRAVDAAANHYPNLDPGDTRRDAFRHTYLSVMLRRYCTSPVAKMVTDLNEELRDNNPAASKYMDLHNNDLGREVKYAHFRGRRFWDRWSWGVWSHRVRDYINDGNNGVFIGGWRQSAPTEENARAGEALVPDDKYIYFQ